MHCHTVAPIFEALAACPKEFIVHLLTVAENGTLAVLMVNMLLVHLGYSLDHY